MDSTIAATLGNEDSRVGCRVSPAAGAAKAVSAAAEDGAGGLNQQAPEQNDIVTPCRAGPDVRVSGRGDPHPEGALHTVTLLGTLPHDELVSEEDNRGFGLIFAGVDQCGELVANGIGSIVGFGRKDQHRLFAVDLVPGRYTLQTPRQYEEQQNQQVLNFLLHRISRISRCKDTLFRAENTNPRQKSLFLGFETEGTNGRRASVSEIRKNIGIFAYSPPNVSLGIIPKHSLFANVNTGWVMTGRGL